MDPVAEEEEDAANPKFGKPSAKETKSTKQQYSDTSKEDLLSRRKKNPQSSDGSSLSSTSSASLNGRHTLRSFVANTSSSASDNVIDPTPGAYNVYEIPPSQDEVVVDLLSNCKNPPSLESSSLSSASLNSRRTSLSFVANTSSSDVIEQSPEAYHVDQMTIPSTQDEEIDHENVCTPSEKIASLHLSGQRSSPDKADASPNHDYDPKVIHIGSPSQALESDTEPMNTSNKLEMVETEAYFNKETIDDFEIPKFQQVLNEGQLVKENVLSSTSSSKSVSPDALEPDHEVTQSGQFQAWQTSVGSSFADGTRSRSTSAGKPVVPASDNQTQKYEPAKPRQLSSEPDIAKVVTIEKHTEKTRSSSAPPRKTKTSKQPLENPANTQYLLSDDPPNQTIAAQKKDISSLHLHFTETAQDSGLGEPSTSKATESRQSKDADVVYHGESDGEEDLFGDESNNEDKEPELFSNLATKKSDIDNMEGNDKGEGDVVAASQDWHLHFTQTQGDTQGGRNSDGDQGVNNKQVTGSETQSAFQKPKDVSSSRTPIIVDLSPVEEYQNSSFIKNSNISESPQERSGTGFHFSLPKDDSLKPVSEVIPSVADIMKKGLQGPQHHSTPVSEKEDSADSDEITDIPENQVEAVNKNPTPSLMAETIPYSEGTPVFNIILPPNTSEFTKITNESPKAISKMTGLEKAKDNNPNDVSARSDCSFNSENNKGNQPSEHSTSAVQDGDKALNFSGDTEIIEEDTVGDIDRQSVNKTCGRQKDNIVKGKDYSVKRSTTSARRQSPRKHGNGQKERRDPFEFSDSQCYGTPVQSKKQTDMGNTVSIKRRRLVDPQAGQSGRKKLSKKVSPRSTGKGTAKRKTQIRSGQLNRSDSSKVDEHVTANEEQNEPSTSTKLIENPLDKSDSKVTWFKKITTVTTTNVLRHIREEAIRNGVIIEVKERTEVDPPIVKVTEHHDPSPVSPSRTTSSITSGDLGDVSSLSTSKSSSSSGNSFMRSLSSTSLPRSSNVIISPQISTSDSSEKGTRLGASKQTPNKPNCKEDEHLKNKVRSSSDKNLKKVAFTEPSTSTHLTRARRCFSDDSIHLSLKSKGQGVPSKSNEPQVGKISVRSSSNASLTSLKSNNQVITSEGHEGNESVDKRTTDFSNSSKTTENSKSLKVKNKTVSNIKEVEFSSKSQPLRRCSPRKAKRIQDNEESSGTEPPQPEQIKDCSISNISFTSVENNQQLITSEANKSVDETTTDSSSSSKTNENTKSLESNNQTMSNIKETEFISNKQPPRRHSPRKAKGIQTTEESSGDLTEPPEPELGNYLLPGVRVLARWRDGYYYPGTIDKEDSPNRYLFCFDDGDLRVVAINDILHKSWLPKGQMVLAESSNELYSLGKIIGYFRDDEDSCGYIIENNSGESQRYPRSKVILNKEQATPLVQSPANTYLNTGLNLDNIVSGKRLRGRSAADTCTSNVDKPHTSKKAPDKKLKGSPAVTSPRKRLRTPVKDQEELIEKPYTPTLKKRKTRTEDEDSTSSAPVHASTFMGPLPKNKSLFKGINFLITVGDVVKKSTTSPTDTSAGSNSEDEMLMKFNRDYACKQIMVGGGNVLKSYDSSHKCLGKVYLISNTHCRTKKYFLALAAGLPCISHQWLKHSCNLNALQDIQSYVLYAGESLEEDKLIECTMKRSVLRGMNIMVVSEQEETKNTWTSILHAARCDVVSNLPSIPLDADVAFTCDVIVTDQTCPKSIRDKAAELDVPMVSTEWVIQCLINGYRPDYCAHPSYVWNYCKKKH